MNDSAATKSLSTTNGTTFFTQRTFKVQKVKYKHEHGPAPNPTYDDRNQTI